KGGKAFGCVKLGNGAAGLADQQRGRGAFMRVRAGNIGVAALDLVDEPMRLEKIECPVDGDRCRPGTVACHPVDNLIGTRRRVALSYTSKYVPALSREAGAAAAAHPLGTGDQLVRTVTMIVAGLGKGHSVKIEC